MSDFQGAGGPPPRTQRSGGGGAGLKNWPEFGFNETIQAKNKEGKVGNYPRRLPVWFLKRGDAGRKILLLDRLGQRFSVLTHNFVGRDGKFGNVLISPDRTDPLGDPMNEALADERGPKEPSWGWVLTGIDINGRTPKPGGKRYENQRCLVFVTEKQADMFRSLEKMGGGFRGQIFDVSRDQDQQSFKIGTKWDPDERLTEDQMKERFAKPASDYGLPVEKFLEPVDYKTVLAPLPRQKLVEIANDIMGMKQAKSAVRVPDGQEEIEF